MPRQEVMDCKAGHGKNCRSRPWRIWANYFCVCPCHAPLLRLRRKPSEFRQALELIEEVGRS